MYSLAEVARVQTSLVAADVDHLHRLVANWGLLADLSFTDLVLFANADNPDAASSRLGRRQYVVLAQVRPTTSQTRVRSGQSSRPPITIVSSNAHQTSTGTAPRAVPGRTPSTADRIDLLHPVHVRSGCPSSPMPMPTRPSPWSLPSRVVPTPTACTRRPTRASAG